MASGAGSLNVLIGGPAVYNGTLESRPVLGAGRSAMPVHVVAALRLVERSTLLWLALFLIVGFPQRGRSWLIREPIRHGGNLREAARRYSIPLEDWLDSRPASIRAAIRCRRSRRMRGAVCPKTTTVSPHGRALLRCGGGVARRGEPGCDPRVAVAVAARRGRRRAAHVRRNMRPRSNAPGTAVMTLEFRRDLPAELDHVIVANPNNPTTERIAPDVLLRWHEQLAMRGGTLIVDEAFADADNPARRSQAKRSATGSSCCVRSASSSALRAFAWVSSSPRRAGAPTR